VVGAHPELLGIAVLLEQVELLEPSSLRTLVEVLV